MGNDPNPYSTIFGDFTRNENFSEVHSGPTHAEIIGSLHFHERVSFSRRSSDSLAIGCDAVIFGARRLSRKTDIWEVTGVASDWKYSDKPWRRFIAKLDVTGNRYGKFEYIE